MTVSKPFLSGYFSIIGQKCNEAVPLSPTLKQQKHRLPPAISSAE